jgi:hypothetical protein
MSIRNTRPSSTQNTTTSSNSNYVLVRSDIFYFTEVINYEQEIYKINSALSSSPNVIFYAENSTNKVILDYTKANDTDKSFLSTFFAGLTTGSGFTLSNASYLSDVSGLEANLNSNLTFKEFKNNYVFADLNTVQNKNAATDIYDGAYFIQPPQLYSGISLGNTPLTKSMALANTKVNSESLFYNLGVKVDDLIEIVNSDSVNSNKKFKIIKLKEISNKELLFLDGDLVSESLIGKPVLINLYVKGKLSSLEGIDPHDKTTGCCVLVNDQELSIASSLLKYNQLQTSLASGNNLINANSTIIELNKGVLQNTTQKQCEIITGKPNRFFKDCIDETNVPQNLTSLENAEYFAYPSNSLDVSFVNDQFMFTRSSDDNSAIYYKLENNNLYLKPGFLYKFNQRNNSNINKVIIFTLDPELQLNYQKQIWGKNTGVGSNSFIYFRMPLDGITMMYMSVQDTPNITPIVIQPLATS